MSDIQWQAGPGIYITEKAEIDWQTGPNVYLTETQTPPPPPTTQKLYCRLGRQVFSGIVLVE